MMISPYQYIDGLEGASYQELIAERTRLIDEIVAFENAKQPETGMRIDPSPDVIYQVNLEYLAALCPKIEEAYRAERDTREEAELDEGIEDDPLDEKAGNDLGGLGDNLGDTLGDGLPKDWDDWDGCGSCEDPAGD